MFLLLLKLTAAAARNRGERCEMTTAANSILNGAR
jgi:hypothetical protein